MTPSFFFLCGRRNYETDTAGRGSRSLFVKWGVLCLAASALWRSPWIYLVAFDGVCNAATEIYIALLQGHVCQLRISALLVKGGSDGRVIKFPRNDLAVVSDLEELHRKVEEDVEKVLGIMYKRNGETAVETRSSKRELI